MSFNRRERNGVFVLLLLLMTILCLNIFLPDIIEKEEYDFSRYASRVDSFYKAQKENSLRQKKIMETDPAINKTQIKNKGDFKPQYFKFDPNKLEKEKWKQLGLKSWQVKIIENYKSSGGKFFVKSDLKNIYGLDNQLYQKLKPYILLPDSLEKSSYGSQTPEKKTENKQLYNLNQVNEKELKEVKGIGAVFSERIIKYRDLLGGFSSKEQLREVFGIDSITYINLVKRLTLSPEPVNLKVFNINKATASELSNHPYISYKLGRAIVNYRNHHGAYKNKEDLKNIILLNQEKFHKIKPYISVSHGSR